MKVIKPGDYTWMFVLNTENGIILPVLKLIEVDKIGFDVNSQEWIFFDKDDNEYLAGDCVEADYQPTEEKLDV